MIADPESVPLGTMIGQRYRLERKIGKGGFGAVFAASDLQRRELVALKILAIPLLAEAGGEARVEREAELARRLSHPNIVRVLDTGKDPAGVLYIAFELLEGRSIENALREEGPFSPKRACAIAMEILAALEDAHRHGVIHRDIKPANVFLVNPGQDGTGGTVNASAGDRVKVLDFGIAKSTNPHTRAGLTREGTSMGTPEYMAPEQMLGQTVGPFSDLYAVGLVLAEMVIGESPYGPRSTAMSIVLDRIAGKPVPLPAELVASPLGPLVKRATADVVYRFTSAFEMRNALAGIAASLSDRAAMRGHAPASMASAPTAAVGTAGDRTQRSNEIPAARPSSPLASSFAIDGPLDRAPSEIRSSASHAATAPDDSRAPSHLARTAPDSSGSSRSRLAATAPDYGAPSAGSHGAVFLTAKKRLEATVKQDDGFPAASWPNAPATASKPQTRGNSWIIIVVILACVLVLGGLATAYAVMRHRGLI